MPSDPDVASRRVSTFGTLVTLALLALASVWLLQGSINAYIQQTYHRASPLEALADVPGWRTGGIAWQTLTGGHAQAVEAIAAGSKDVTDGFNQRIVLTADYHRRQREDAKRLAAQRQAEVEAAQQAQATREAEERKARYLALVAQDRVFMAGDSLMQGVAPQLQRLLATGYGIHSLNLSRQSTGLSYPSAFDWPATIEQAVQDDPSIRLVVVMLGPNDPWDMPDPDTRGGPFLKFRSEAWERVYRARIARIITANATRGLSTLWIGAPGMKRTQLDTQMAWLMGVVEDEVVRQGAVYLDSRGLLPGAGDDGGYRDSVEVDGRPVKMRSGDGIHFSLAGQRFLAQRILETLQLPPG